MSKLVIKFNFKEFRTEADGTCLREYYVIRIASPATPLCSPGPPFIFFLSFVTFFVVYIYFFSSFFFSLFRSFSRFLLLLGTGTLSLLYIGKRIHLCIRKSNRRALPESPMSSKKSRGAATPLGTPGLWIAYSVVLRGSTLGGFPVSPLVPSSVHLDSTDA